MDLGLDGRGVLVAGGSRGIGVVVAETFAKEGARVAIAARTQDVLQSAAQRISQTTGRTILPVVMDVTNEDSVQAAVESVTAEYGHLDIVVNSAVDVVGGLPGAPSELDAAALGGALDVKVLGMLRVIQAALPHMKAAGYGRLIAVGGASARQIGAASASVRNSALAALCKNVSTEMGPHGITVNVIHPGGVLTERNRARVEQEQAQNGGTFEDAEARLAANVPLGRMVHPEDIAALALFLASPHAAAITGQTIAVDGGATRAITY